MFKRSSASATSELQSPLISQHAEFIASLEKLLQAYKLRSVLTFITGDVVVKQADGTEVDRTKLKARVTQDLIHALKNGCENIRVALVESADNHGLTPNDFLDGKTKEFLNNDALFTLLSTSQISEATLTSSTYEHCDLMKITSGKG